MTKFVLTGVMILFVLSSGAHILIDSALSKEVFDASVAGLFPLVTLVLGYELGNKHG